MTLSELRELNLRDIYRWSQTAKTLTLAFLFMVLLGAAYWFDFSNQLKELSTAKNQENQLRQIFLIKKREAVNLPAYRQQLTDLKRTLSTFLKQLPNRGQMDELLRAINQAGVSENLAFDLFRPGKEILNNFYAELPITIKVEGHYHEMGAFASAVAHLPRIVTLSNADISMQSNGQLLMNVTARTYRYLDANELAAQKKSPGARLKKGNE
ncbi:MAG: type 4a pilus biogenesis protein PilO [Pseudomonadota bacterium]|nr:type 4a pilus biogenesis protein PilO [Pseudomonadota bacterium]